MTIVGRLVSGAPLYAAESLPNVPEADYGVDPVREIYHTSGFGQRRFAHFRVGILSVRRSIEIAVCHPSAGGFSIVYGPDLWHVRGTRAQAAQLAANILQAMIDGFDVASDLQRRLTNIPVAG